jgi:Lanthionine synthetase C-like protein
VECAAAAAKGLQYRPDRSSVQLREIQPADHGWRWVARSSRADQVVDGRIAAAVDQQQHWSLYSGLTGMAVALHAVHNQLGDALSGAAARAALDRVRAHFDGQRWSAMFELLGGNAGIALGALSVGDLDLALLAVTPYLHTADPTPRGVN